MSDKTGISWTDATWNPTTGCTRVSPGCDHCYAFALHDKRYAANLKAARAWAEAQGIDANRGYYAAIKVMRANWPGGLPYPRQYDVPFSRVQLMPDRLDVPLRRKKPKRIFVDSMADLFHEDVPDEFIDRVFATMALAPQHTFQILTKRPERMRAYLASSKIVPRIARAIVRDDTLYERSLDVVMWYSEDDDDTVPYGLKRWPLPNVWLGVSAEDQERADERIPLLLETPATVRFISAEPLLGPISLHRYVGHGASADAPLATADRLDWVIVGGESGARRRELNAAWVRIIREQCRAAGVAYWGKQTSAARPGVPFGEAGLDDKELPA